MKWWYSLLLLLLMTYVIIVPFSILFPSYSGTIIEGGLLKLIILGSVLAPIIETYLNQQLFYSLTKDVLRDKILLISFLSAVLFGLMHWDSIYRILFIGSIGFFLQLWFILLSKRYGHTKAFLMVAFVHGVRNSIATLALYISGVLQW